MPAPRLASHCLLALATIGLLAGCATAPTTPTVYALVGDRLLSLDSDGRVGEPGRRLGRVELQQLTHDPDSGTFFGLHPSGDDVELWKLGRRGKPRRVGKIALPDEGLARVEALAWDREGRRLLAGGGTNHESVFSNLLFEVNPGTGAARTLGPVWTTQRDIDALTFVGDQLLVLDVAANRSHFYWLDTGDGRISPAGQHSGPLDAIAWDPARELLAGFDGSGGRLHWFALHEGVLEAVAAAVESAEQPNLRALVVAIPADWQAPPRLDVYRDGFESGDAHRWSAGSDQGAGEGKP